MNFKTSSGLIGLLLALAAINAPSVNAANQSSDPVGSTNTAQTIENRLSKLSATIRQRETLVPSEDAENLSAYSNFVVAQWFNGGGSAWRRGLFRGFVNGGGFSNAPWGNGWFNGGGFFNY
ncbi:MAG: rSAM-associated Gly-rich repeat protein [Pseudanabaena sp.]|nr:MAG: rSAM-associated Gly-rich repeat protein [Pseudanabaena sp.]